MNSKRKAEIQRKLGMAAVPKPPAGLSDRIKADIPKYLQATEMERQRFSGSVAFNLRIAASIILLVTSVFVAVNLLSPEEMPSVAMAPRSPVASMEAKDAPPSAPQTVSYPATAAPASPAVMDELRVEIREEQPRRQAVAQTADSTIASEARPPVTRRADERRERAAERDAEEVSAAGGVASGGTMGRIFGAVAGAPASAPPPPPPAPPVSVAEAAPVPPPVATTAANTTPAASAPVPAMRAEIQQQQPHRKSTSLVSEAMAADLALGPHANVFGIDVDPAVFHSIKSTLERGAKPAASSINVDALVNYFTGAPKSVKRDVQLDVEASPAPVASPDGRRGLVRFTVDTLRRELGQGSSVPPVATDAHLDITFHDRAVKSFRRIGSGEPSAAEPVLLQNTSVTGLYEVELKPNLAARQPVATVTLRYKSLATGKPQTRTKVLYGTDFTRRWSTASRRHRLASLGALWAETLRGNSGATELAVKAEELATQAPGDAKARELANAATVSSKL